MGIFSYLGKNKSQKQAGPLLTAEINYAIVAFEEYHFEEADYINWTIVAYINDEERAIELFRFLPIAYCSSFFPDVDFQDHYLEKKMINLSS